MKTVAEVVEVSTVVDTEDILYDHPYITPTLNLVS